MKTLKFVLLIAIQAVSYLLIIKTALTLIGLMLIDKLFSDIFYSPIVSVVSIMVTFVIMMFVLMYTLEADN